MAQKERTLTDEETKAISDAWQSANKTPQPYLEYPTAPAGGFILYPRTLDDAELAKALRDGAVDTENFHLLITEALARLVERLPTEAAPPDSAPPK